MTAEAVVEPTEPRVEEKEVAEPYPINDDPNNDISDVADNKLIPNILPIKYTQPS